MGRAPIPEHWFNRCLFNGHAMSGDGVRIWGFTIRFPGRTPITAKSWLKAHGYIYSCRRWCRADRTASKLSYDEHQDQRKRVTARRARYGYSP